MAGMDTESKTLNAWREAWIYLCYLMGRSSKIPTPIKYSVGEDLLKDMLRVGQLIDKAHILVNTKPYKSKQLVMEASDLYDTVKFTVNQLIDAKIPSTETENADQYVIMSSKSREHLSKLMYNFGGWLGGWLKNIQPAGKG